MSNEMVIREEVGRHEVQYAVVTLSRDKEFVKLIDLEIPHLKSVLISRFAPIPVSIKDTLFKSQGKYYLGLEVDIEQSRFDCCVLINDSGPAFIIETSKQCHSLLSAKRVMETLFDSIMEHFEVKEVKA